MAALAEADHDVLQVRRVLHGRRGDAHDLAADGDEVERLLHAFGGIHRVAREHGLHHDRVIAADDDAAARRVAHDDFARFAALIEEWRLAVFHFRGTGAGAGAGA
jgi:hypothetical protein